MTRASRWVLAAGLVSWGLVVAADESAQTRFAEANALARAGDYPKAIATWAALATTGTESASLYWNWAQAASARGARGEALWALLRARELDPGDAAVSRDIERVRETLALDAAEVAPDPRPVLARWGRRLRLDLIAVALVALSLSARAIVAFGHARRPAAATSWAAGVLGLLIAAGLGAAATAGAQAVVVRKGAPLVDSASPSAEAVGALREGEVVPVLAASAEWIRVEDSSGARGWAHVDDVRRLDRPPAALRP